jgi:hypothetical protein
MSTKDHKFSGGRGVRSKWQDLKGMEMIQRSRALTKDDTCLYASLDISTGSSHCPDDVRAGREVTCNRGWRRSEGQIPSQHESELTSKRTASTMGILRLLVWQFDHFIDTIAIEHVGDDLSAIVLFGDLTRCVEWQVPSFHQYVLWA